VVHAERPEDYGGGVLVGVEACVDDVLGVDVGGKLVVGDVVFGVEGVAGEEVSLTCVGGIVLLNEVADIDLVLPCARTKAVLILMFHRFLLSVGLSK